ncbi:MAG: plastocyanin/azurin family copper-binding protein [Limisphaerales bacterium]
MSLFRAVLVSMAMVVSLRAGDISGFVHAKGKLQANDEAGSSNYQSHKFKFAEKVNYDELTDFVVYIEGKFPDAKAPTEVKRVVTQKDATFHPHVLPVMAGTKVEWPNEDEIFHNVFSISESNPFDLDLYKKGQTPKPVTFMKPGKVDVFCSIHAKMYCIVLVLDNPYFASADGKGHYKIVNVPAGTYRITAWHERLPKLTQEITVKESGTAKMDFMMGIKNLPKP